MESSAGQHHRQAARDAPGRPFKGWLHLCEWAEPWKLHQEVGTGPAVTGRWLGGMIGDSRMGHFYQWLTLHLPSSYTSAQLSSMVQLPKHRSMLHTCEELAQERPHVLNYTGTFNQLTPTFHSHHPTPLLRSKSKGHRS